MEKTNNLLIAPRIFRDGTCFGCTAWTERKKIKRLFNMSEVKKRKKGNKLNRKCLKMKFEFCFVCFLWRAHASNSWTRFGLAVLLFSKFDDNSNEVERTLVKSIKKLKLLDFSAFFKYKSIKYTWMSDTKISQIV